MNSINEWGKPYLFAVIGCLLAWAGSCQVHEQRQQLYDACNNGEPAACIILSRSANVPLNNYVYPGKQW